MKNKWKKIVWVVMVWVFGLTSASMTWADGDININVSPMRESVVLNPGDVYKSSFMVSNPGYSEQDLYYHVDVKPFYVDEEYNPVFDDSASERGSMFEWVKITSGEKGKVAPNNTAVVEYEINVPENAPAGGQYACLSAVTDVEPSTTGAINIGEGIAINHVILAEITGDTVIAGEIKDVGIQSFMLGGRITAYSTVVNAGNVHGLATYTMRVYPLFSDEPIYTNEGQAEDHYVLPDRLFHNESYWDETPMMGVYNVSYTVEFQGQKSEANRMVIICPWWLLFIIILGIIVLVMRIVSLRKLQKTAKSMEDTKKRNGCNEI